MRMNWCRKFPYLLVAFAIAAGGVRRFHVVSKLTFLQGWVERLHQECTVTCVDPILANLGRPNIVNFSTCDWWLLRIAINGALVNVCLGAPGNKRFSWCAVAITCPDEVLSTRHQLSVAELKEHADYHSQSKSTASLTYVVAFTIPIPAAQGRCQR